MLLVFLPLLRFRVGGAVTISESGISIHSGIVTATSFVGDGSALTGTGNTADVRTSTLTVIGVSTIGAGATFTIGAGAGNGIEFLNGSSSKIRLSTDDGATSPRLFLGAVSSNTGAKLQVNASTGVTTLMLITTSTSELQQTKMQSSQPQVVRFNCTLMVLRNLKPPMKVY